MSKAGKDSGVTSIGTEHPKADEIPHLSPLTNTISRGDSISGASPPSNPNNPLSGDAPPIMSGAGMHRGSINGIPGGGLPGVGGRSPIKESSFLARSASIDEEGMKEGSGHSTITTSTGVEGTSPPPKKEGIPIRR